MLTGNPVLTPNNNGGAEPVIGGSYTITWDGTGLGKVVDLALCQGPSAACNIVSDIALGIPNSNSYSWSVPCSLSATASNAGFGVLLIDDATGQYQYSTQFGFLADSSGVCSGSSTGSASATGSAPSGSPTGGDHSRTGHSGSMTTSASGSAPTGSGSAPTAPGGGYGLNSTSTSYVVPTGPAGTSPTYAPSGSSSSASTVARSMGGLAVAMLAAALVLA
jgi:hypothetical protein